MSFIEFGKNILAIFSEVGFHWQVMRINLFIVAFIFIFEIVILGPDQSSLKKIIHLKKSSWVDIQYFLFKACNLARPITVLMFFGLTWKGNQLGQRWQLNYLQGLDAFPLAKALITLILSEFLDYWAHRANHHIPFLWEFHKVHHSAPEMSVLTDFRGHPGDNLSDFVLRLFPLSILGLTAGEFMPLAMLRIFLSALQHSNLQWNLGFFGKYLFLSPRAHHFHHSQDPKHHHTNYGFFFPWFDHLFGTWCEDSNDEEVLNLTYGLEAGTYEKASFLQTIYLPYIKFWQQLWAYGKSYLQQKLSIVLHQFSMFIFKNK